MDKISKKIAAIILTLMFLFMILSVKDDAATFDEVAHIPAGYSYITQLDYRLNPEHPPLIKSLSAIPLLFLNLNFPKEFSGWKDEINGQWSFGHYFLYEANKNTDQILFWARFPIIILALILGWLLFLWAAKNYGNKVGLLTLFFYALSPNIIAHSRYVTTDLGATFGFFIGIVTFIKFLKNPSRKNIIIAGLCFGIAQLIKFSLVVLAPLYILLALIYFISENYEEIKNNFGFYLKKFLFLLWKIFLIGIIGLMVICFVYAIITYNYPKEHQIRSAQTILNTPGAKLFLPIIIWLSEHKIFQGLGEYLFGLIMMIQRAAGGNTVYFLGKVSATGSVFYFPVLYFLKEPLAFHILTIIILIFSINNILKTKEKNLKAMTEWIKDNFSIAASAIFVFIYLSQAILSNLNLGLRHILPTLPFIYFMVARQAIRWARGFILETPQTLFGYLRYFYRTYIKSLERYIVLFCILLWIFISDLLAFPYFLSYYNELGGGVWNGYKIATDSNYDWGQDLIRLKNWLDKNPEITKINLDYFGGGDPRYYLKDRFEPWWSSRGKPNDGEWLAVSVNSLQGAMAKPVKGFNIKPEDTYWWLKDQKPVYHPVPSILIYKF